MGIVNKPGRKRRILSFVESCRGLSDAGGVQRALKAKETEIHYLRDKLKKLDTRSHIPNLPTIYIITPTYARLVQVT